VQWKESFNETVLNSLAATIAVLDKQGNIIAVNDAWRRFARENGASASLESGVGLNYLEVCRTASGFSAEGAQECLTGLGAVLDDGLGEFESEYPCHSSSEQRWFLLRAVPLLDTEGGLVISHINISQRKRAEQEIQRSCLQNIFDSMPSSLVGVDPEGRITEWNDAAERLMGVSAAQAEGRCLVSVLPQFAGVLELLKEALSQRQPVSSKRLVIRGADTLQYADIMVYPLLAETEVVGAVVRIDDVSERVRLEQMLVQTEKMSSVGALAAGMAHELNNPLGVVLQGSQNILRRLSSDLPRNQRLAAALSVNLQQLRAYLEQSQILNFLEGIAEAARRAAQIVADMKTFSDCGYADFRPARLEDMLDTAVRLANSDLDLRRQYDFRQVEIIRDYDPELGIVYCNPTAIEQVFFNLLKNAAQALADVHRDTAHRIILRTRGDGDWVRVEVEDNGAGMDEETRRHLFEPFFTTKPPGVGTGLGLSVSYFIVREEHGGSIAASSKPGSGTCFTIRLPRCLGRDIKSA
jgi:PAS domain S-box-containing protein